MARALALVLLAALPALAADEAYTLKLYKDKEGDVFKSTQSMKADGTVSYAVGTEKGTEKEQQGEKLVFTEEVLKWPADAKRASKLRRVYEAVERTDAKGEKVPSTLAGKTVVAERGKDANAYTVDGKAPTPEQVVELELDFGGKSDTFDKHDMMPDKPVKVGDTWAVDKKKLLAAAADMKGFKFDADKCQFTGKLVKAAKKDGVLYGTVEIALTFALTEFPFGETGSVPTEAGSVMTVVGTVEGCLDGSAPSEKLSMVMKMDVKAKLPMNGTLAIANTVTITDIDEPVKKK